MQDKNFVAYEYKTKTVKNNERAKIMDLYEAFGWEATEVNSAIGDNCVITLRRDRKIPHKQELIKLEKKAEEERAALDSLERSKTLGASIFAYRMRRKCNFGNVVDLIVVPLLTGQIIGRLGNFVNQEAFGIPITDPRLQTFPFAVWIDQPQGVEPEYHDLVYSNVPGWFAATFFYEMVWNFIGACIFFAIWRKNKRFPGILGFCYFFWYFLAVSLVRLKLIAY